MRAWHGHGFGTLVPEEWVDRTVPALTGPLVRGSRAGLTVTVDEKPGTSNAEAFAASRIPAAMAPPGRWELLSQERVSDEVGVEAVAAELRWEGRGAGRLFRRLYYRVLDRVGYVVTCHLKPESRRLMGPATMRMALSLVRLDPAQEDAAVAPTADPGSFGGGRFTAAGFAMDLYPGWEDASLYRIGRPHGLDLLPNLVVWHQGLRGTGWGTRTLRERARAETEQMRATIPGFELIAEGEIKLGDGQAVPHREFFREAGLGTRLRQGQIVVTAPGKLYTVCVTCAGEAEEDQVAESTAVMESFVLGGAAPAAVRAANGVG